MRVLTAGISSPAVPSTARTDISIRRLGFSPRFRVAQRNKSLLQYGFSDSMRIKDREHLGRVPPRSWRDWELPGLWLIFNSAARPTHFLALRGFLELRVRNLTPPDRVL
jgi:hypothetical protein